jgi:pyridinium-3,5-bisthiocarboxylic acid mononucleotide nickel chelatase
VKVLQFDSIGGASGDMILGALIELGIDAAVIEKELSAISIGPFSIEASPSESHHLLGTQVTVKISGHGHAERRLRDIQSLIGGSKLPQAVKDASLRVFTRIGEAEAKVHGTTLDQIHFHEVGALDSIIDIVGCCLGLHLLKVDGVAVGPLPAGHGIITCAHGTFPNPAPATVELLKGHPIVQTDESKELVTPTGAALLSTWKTMDAPPPGSRVMKAAHSFGHHQLEKRPNLLRAFLLEAEGASAPETCLVLECNLDDTTPELLGSLTQRLMEAGALDVFTTSVQMKKQRPGTLLTVLCTSGKRDGLLDLVFRESTTFGVREYETRRTVLERRFVEADTRYGRVRIKIGTWKGQDVTYAPEMEDCIARAREAGVAVRVVYESAVEAAQRLRA